ncbi:hypothetical protein [Bacillus sp. FJAT-44742]|uniref:hypothetical protein n=1 Tax=Bacillus sp. FJAT-44742 TaxID=2014005 RepID=UPI0018E28CE1|nr:hypothetical protein [Bacillus sp. FJAT-44742]
MNGEVIDLEKKKGEILISIDLNLDPNLFPDSCKTDVERLQHEVNKIASVLSYLNKKGEMAVKAQLKDSFVNQSNLK